MAMILTISALMSLILYLPATHSQLMCPLVGCSAASAACPYVTYFTLLSGRICRGCNVCINPGSPTDSSGCPTMQCDSSSLPPNMCKDPRYYNSWLDYGDRKCPTCWATLCRITS